MIARPPPAGILAAVWGLAGVVALVGNGVRNVWPHVEVAVRGGLTAVQWAMLIGWSVVMAWTEGYRGFQRAFAPRVVARALALARRPTLVRGLLAPAFCMALFAAPRRRLIVSWSVLVGVIGLVIGVSRIAQPWRGVIDAGVVVGLAWGLVALLVIAVRAALGRPPGVDPQLP